MTDKKKDCVCRDHSGIDARVTNLEADRQEQWTELNGIKKFALTSLFLMVLSLLGIIVQLAVTLAG